MYQRNGKWYSDFWYEGKRYTKGWGRISKSIAKEKERRFRNDIASGKYEVKKKNILFERMVEQYLDYVRANNRYKTYLSKVTSTNALLTLFKGKCLSDIHPFLIDRYKKDRLQVVTPASVNRELSCLKHLFTIAIDWSFAHENPVKKVKMLKEEERDVKVLTWEKEAELYAALSIHPYQSHCRAIVVTALNTGMRAREVFDLRKENVNLRKRVIHVTHTKNWEMRDIPMNEMLTKVLKEAIKKFPESPYVFVNPKTGKPYTSIKTSFNKALEKIGLAGFRFHDLRHTWCSRMCELGVDEATIQELGGWKTRSMIKRYAHPSMDHKREALEKLSRVPLILPLVDKKTYPSNMAKTLTSDKIKTI
jgi:integrase